ncbi:MULTISPECIES: GNAT family N-acetyltransferase [unclassified Bacillus cereus group]|uniref:GNAT family N-acetyltransferase n=1 Tax=unclassified Bacillus cereus group TaxID=2750818 RepID=UPI001F57D55F|nr:MULTISPECIES: GNAT family N-acetyltransferase [unclassified Bacillus cereus group]
MKVRNIQSEDYIAIHSVLNEWWGGRNMTDMLPKLFFTHFQETSFVIEEDGEIVGFLCGFLSQTYKNEAYVHFIGVNPKYRRKGIASTLYSYFFDAVRVNHRHIVKAVTSSVNKGSIQFHQEIGFEMEVGDEVVDGVSVHTNYDGNGENRVSFVKRV